MISSKNTKSVFIETEPYEKGFAKYYEKNLKPHVDEFEESRQQSLKTVCKRFITVIFVTIALSLIGWVLATTPSSYYGDSRSFIFICILIEFGILLWAYKPIENYQSSLKSKIFPDIIAFFNQFQYWPECTSVTNELAGSKIIPRHDIENSKNQISGKYKDVTINLFETHLRKDGGCGRRRYYSTVFQGAVILLNVNKNFKSLTIVKRDLGILLNWFRATKERLADLENVKLEDPKFENMFEVYSNDQIEARYLLTTSFMERLLNLAQHFKSKAIECSFYSGMLVIMIPYKKSMFESGSMFKSEDFIDDSKSLLKSMNIIFGIVDALKLDQNIGM